jgi:hypothetical protein
MPANSPMGKRRVRLTVGDRVKMEISSYDLDKARIRHSRCSRKTGNSPFGLQPSLFAPRLASRPYGPD